MSTDQELLTRFVQTRDPAAFDTVVTRHAAMVYATARRICGDEAGDVTQTVFLTLFRKAEALRGYSNLAGWLYETARLAAVNARRVATRRRLHETEAAVRKSEAIDRASGTESAMLAEVDEAIRRLPDKARDAVVLRYFEGRSPDEVAACLGITQAAAGKRVTRAVEQLRATLARRGVVAPAATVAAVLLAQGSTPAPAVVLSSITTGALAAASASTATSVAGSGSLLGWKAVACVTAFLLSTAAVVGFVVVPWITRPPAVTSVIVAPVQVAAPASTTPDVFDPAAEARVPGESCLARFTTLIDAAALPELETATKATDGTDVRLGPAAAIFAVLRSADAADQVVQNDNSMDHHTLVQGSDLPIYMPQFFKDFDRDQRKYEVSFTWSNNLHITAIENGSIELNLVAPGIKTFLQEYSTEPPIRRSATLDLDWKGTIAPGEAVAVVHDLGPIREHHFAVVTVFHVYRGTVAELGRIRGLRAGDKWISLGPDGSRAVVDRAIKWAGGRKLEASDVLPRWTKKLDNKMTVRLLAVGRPKDFPFCWWDATGNPIDRDWTNLGTQLDAEKAVVFSYYNDAADSQSSEQAFVIPRGGQALDLWLGNGPWQEKEIKIGETVEIGDGYVTFAHQVLAGTTMVAVIKGDLGPDVDVYIDGFTAAGERIKPRRDSSACLVTTAYERWQREDENLYVAKQSLARYVLRWQLRQKAAFEGFADAPKKTP